MSSGRTRRSNSSAVTKSHAHRLFFQGRAVLVRGLGDFGGIVVTDLRRERSDQHQRAFHQRLDMGAIGLDARDAIVGEADGRIADQADRLQHDCRSSRA